MARFPTTTALRRLCSAGLRLTLVLVACGGAATALAGCDQKTPWHDTDLTGSSLSNLDFSMTRADDGKAVDAKDYRGKVVMLYFGYTFCPDVCPLTIANAVEVLHKLKDKAKDVRVLFVTVDPDRDTVPVLKDYVSAFAPEVDGLRGTPDELAAMARRYRVAYSVDPSPDPSKYVVSHSSAVYVFDKTGAIRLLVTSLDRNDPKTDDVAEDIGRLVDEDSRSATGPLAWIGSIF
ncbi:MAG: SCO family protein [Pararhizobium sp.]